MPARLRPTAPIAADALLVGDPARALLLAQELLTEPKMSNHARGLWGYFGQRQGSGALTIQATGMGGPSAALVLADLVELGVRRVVRVGTCAGRSRDLALGDLVLVEEAVGEGGSIASLGLAAGATVGPDPPLTGRLRGALGSDGQSAKVASVDAHPAEAPVSEEIDAVDMQTAPLLAHAHSLRVPAAAVLIVAELFDGTALDKDELESAEKRAGRAASGVLSS
jgi:uridine phosphorylase